MELGWIASGFKTVASHASTVLEWQTLYQRLRGQNSVQLHEELWKLQTTIPLMQDRIDKAEWSSHKGGIANLLQELKGVFYDSENILEELKYYRLKSKTEKGGLFSKITQKAICCSFDDVKTLRQKAEHLISQIDRMVLNDGCRHYVKSSRPETTSFPNELKIFGRQKEIKDLIQLLGVPLGSQKRKRGNTVAAALTDQVALIHGSENEGVDVLAIIGIGGVGKTTLAQQICQDKMVRAHFNQVLWSCVSDDFDVTRLTKEVLLSSGQKPLSDNLNSLQTALANVVSSKRYLLILDDMWDDVLIENGQEWDKFCAPLTNGLPGSMIVVTTRSLKVAGKVGTIGPFALEGLREDIFWEFFRSCAFKCKGCQLDADLEIIGKQIALKLKGSPLAAKTLGRLLGMSHDIDHWNNVLNSELWQLKQEKHDILPALRLSYLYLPFHLKRCVSFCAMYPKDYLFAMSILVEMWSAQGLVEPQGHVPISTVGQSYFEELRDRSFFQLASTGRATYVIHDLIHDMLQMVSAGECFIVRNECDLLNVPQNVQHLSLMTERSFDCTRFMDLSSCKKVRSIFIKEPLNKTALVPIIESLSKSLKYLRFLSCGFNTINELPEGVSRFKLLRFLEVNIRRRDIFKTFPKSYCCLYNLEIFKGRNCVFENLPRDFSRLVNLYQFEVAALWQNRDHTEFSASEGYDRLIQLLKNMNLKGELVLRYLSYVQPNSAHQTELSKQHQVHKLTLNFGHEAPIFGPLVTSDKDMEVLEALCPHPNVQWLVIENCRGTSCPTWFNPSNLQSLMQLHFTKCDVVTVSWGGSNSGSNPDMFTSLVDLLISGCGRISSLEQLLQPACLPVIETIAIELCPELEHVPVETLKDFQNLKRLSISGCPKINWQLLVKLPSSLQNLEMILFGHSSDYFVSCLQGLTLLMNLLISCDSLTSIPREIWPSLERVNVENCSSLTNFHFTRRSMPAVKVITIQGCRALSSVAGGRFRDFNSLEELMLSKCPNVQWSDLTFPISLRKLYIEDCGDVSAWIPNCLVHLNSLSHLALKNLRHIKSIFAEIWSNSLTNLEFLEICRCPDLIAIGGSEAIAGINNVFIESCGKLKEIKQPIRRGRRPC